MGFLVMAAGPKMMLPITLESELLSHLHLNDLKRSFDWQVQLRISYSRLIRSLFGAHFHLGYLFLLGHSRPLFLYFSPYTKS